MGKRRPPTIRVPNNQKPGYKFCPKCYRLLRFARFNGNRTHEFGLDDTCVECETKWPDTGFPARVYNGLSTSWH